MAKRKRFQPRPRNPITEARHKRDMWWQVYLPLLFGALVFIGLATWVMLSAFDSSMALNTSAFADAMTIMLLTALISVLLGGLVAVGAMIWGVMWLINWIPGNIRIVHDYLFLAVEYVTRWMQPVRKTALSANQRFDATANSLHALQEKVEQRLVRQSEDSLQ